MNVETRKSNIQVVIIRLLGELAAKAGTVDLPLLQSIINRLWKGEEKHTSHPRPSPTSV